MVPDAGEVLRRRHDVASIIRLGALSFAVLATLRFIETAASSLGFALSGVQASGVTQVIPSEVRQMLLVQLAATVICLFALGCVWGCAAALARAVVPMQQPKCPRCGYALTRLVIPECPECGLALPREIANAPDPRAPRQATGTPPQPPAA